MKKKTSGIAGSLTKKLGPLPVWAWAAVAFIGLWWYRSKTATTSGTGTGSVGPAPVTPQAQTVLQPGESVYDPNSGQLTTAPGGSVSSPDSSGGGGGSINTGSDIAASIDALTTAIAALENTQGGTTSTPGGGSGVGTATPSTPAATAASLPRLDPGGIRARSGPKRPPPKPGFRVKGLGKGNWEYVPLTGGKRKPKTKSQHGAAPNRNTRPVKPGTKTKARSTTSIKSSTGGRTGAKGATKTMMGRVRGGPKAHATAARGLQSTRHSTPLVSHPVVRQRPMAANTPSASAHANAQVVSTVHRTAGTPPRTVRTPAVKPKRKR